MQRITISVDDDIAGALDAFVADAGYGNRSEALRDLIRDAVSRRAASASGQTCLGVLSYLYDHERRDLSHKITRTHHDHHVLNLSTLHLHLDRHSCLEVAVLKGTAAELSHLADHVRAERGVQLGELRLIAEDSTADGSRG